MSKCWMRCCHKDGQAMPERPPQNLQLTDLKHHEEISITLEPISFKPSRRV